MLYLKNDKLYMISLYCPARITAYLIIDIRDDWAQYVYINVAGRVYGEADI